MDTTAQAWIEAHVRTIEPLSRDAQLASWNGSVTGKREYQEEGARLDTQIRKLYSSPEAFSQLKAFEAADDGSDPLLSRQLRLLHLYYAGNQSPPDVIEKMVRLEKQLESKFNNFRAELNGARVSDNHIKEILRTEDSAPLRRAAWEASKQIGSQVSDDIRALVRLRNGEARRLGYRDYFAMSLELQELDEKRLFEIFARLLALSEAPFSAYRTRLDENLARRFGVSVSELRPWHYEDPFFQEAPADGLTLDAYFEGRKLEPLATAHFKGLGLEVEDILARSDLYEKPGKSQHAFCTCLDRKDDVRILCNLISNERWMETLLHELGHAVYDKYLDRDLPYLLRMPAHILSTEAIAMLNGRFTRDPGWLEARAGVPGDEARGLDVKLTRRFGEQIMILTRWVMVMTHFERDLYANPDADLDSLWWDHAERFQMIRRPDGRKHPDWAAKVHIALAPVYYQNYLLGEMTASQMASHIRNKVLSRSGGSLGAMIDRKEAGDFLKREVFRVGARYPWEEALQRATGEGLNPEHFVAEYGS